MERANTITGTATRRFIHPQSYPDGIEGSVEEELCQLAGRPAILELDSGARIEVVFARRKRDLGFPVMFYLLDDTPLPSIGRVRISYITEGTRRHFTAYATGGPGRTIFTTCPTEIREG
ncbi:MAG: hypothetical protein KC416_02290 [Myxococcales bacterium]|nr:hypothetical protein [Myxococcales bacterium]